MNYQEIRSVKQCIGIFTLVFLFLSIPGAMILHLIGININADWFAELSPIFVSYIFAKYNGRVFNKFEYRSILLGSIVISALWSAILALLVIISKNSDLIVSFLFLLGKDPNQHTKIIDLIGRGSTWNVFIAFSFAIVFIALFRSLIFAFMYSSIVMRFFVKKGSQSIDSNKISSQIVDKKLLIKDSSVSTRRDKLIDYKQWICLIAIFILTILMLSYFIERHLWQDIVIIICILIIISYLLPLAVNWNGAADSLIERGQSKKKNVDPESDINLIRKKLRKYCSIWVALLLLFAIHRIIYVVTYLYNIYYP